MDKTADIAALNDLFRTGIYPLLGRWLITEGIQACSPDDQLAVFQKVRTFSTFSEANNPHGERDFGAFEHGGKRIFWKIDYYADRHCQWGSEDPADTAKCYRVLTIMLASEY